MTKILVTGTAGFIVFFTVYSPYMRPDLVLFKFVRSILLNEQFSLYNNGEMMRDFTYIDDIVDGVTSAVDRVSGCEILNSCRGETI